jgi:glycosyltransferase involved in cell wall biosynthesis
MTPGLSIIVGSSNARASIEKCLTELEDQCKGEEVEIIVVDNSTDGSADIVRQKFTQVTLLTYPELTFIPELWEWGIRKSKGEIVAITTAHCIPHKKWIEAILKAHTSDYAGIGGAVENDPSGNLVDWAIYFCRYSRYMLPFLQTAVDDFAGDNASYKRWAIDRCKDIRSKGFWEPFVHAKLRQEGLQLIVSPGIVVYHYKSFSLAGFLQNRFGHGREFGCSRAAKFSGFHRLLYILLSPFIPVILFFRILRQVAIKKRNLLKFIGTLPIVILFLCSWALGELFGYFMGTGNE